MKKNRRTTEGYRLRVYIDAIHDAKAMTDEEWIEAWATNPAHCRYVPRNVWIAYLEQCAIREAEAFMRLEAA